MNLIRGRLLMLAGGCMVLSIVALTLGIDIRNAAAQGGAVSIVDFAFQPGSLEVTTGSTVTWTNTGAAPHTVSADDGSFDSGTLSPGSTFSQTFNTAGTFTYHCNIHPSMTAAIIVGDSGGSGSQAPAAAEQPAAAGAAAPAAEPAKVPRTGIGTASLGKSTDIALLAGLAAIIFGAAAVAYRRA